MFSVTIFKYYLIKIYAKTCRFRDETSRNVDVLFLFQAKNRSLTKNLKKWHLMTFMPF